MVSMRPSCTARQSASRSASVRIGGLTLPTMPPAVAWVSARWCRVVFGARQMEQVHRTARGVGQHEGFGDRELLGQRRPRPVIAFEAARTRSLHLLDEHADELGLLAVEAQGDTAVGAVLDRGRGDLAHQEIEMAEVVA